MGSGGTEWETADTFDTARLNKKTRFVGTGEQATTFITSPQIGQTVYSTESDSTFIKDKLAFYDSSSAWVCPHITETSEQTLGDTSGTGGGLTSGRKNYRIVTLPTTEKFYIITDISFREGNTSGNVLLGADLLESTTPSVSSAPLVAVARIYNSSGTTDLVVKVPNVASKIIRGGSILGIFVVQATGGQALGVVGDTNLYYRTESIDTTPQFIDSNAISNDAGAIRPALKIHFRGYS